MLTNGVETSRAEDSVLRVCTSRGYRHINVFTTPTCIIIADDKFDGLSFMRTIKRRSIDLNKIDLLNTVSRDFVQNPEMTTDEAINKLKKIATKSHSFKKNHTLSNQVMYQKNTAKKCCKNES